ncbi:MAG: signal peptidase II [Bacteroidales bacterium]|nr:signal peptidase II [Bacteroidales bacterium]
MMKRNRVLRIIVILLILGVNVGCDQISKHIVRHTIAYHEEVVVIKNFFILMKVENTGAFLSFGNSLPKVASFILLTIIPFILLIFGVFYLLTKVNISNMRAIAICLIIGGGFGNLFDRAMYGSVTDFMYMNFGFFHTGVFNIADVSIMAGMFMILFETYILNKRREKKAISSESS